MDATTFYGKSVVVKGRCKPVVSVAIVLVAGCLSTGVLVTPSKIATEIPAGTTVEVATERMEKWGYECRLKSNAKFIEVADDGTKITHELKRFLSCTKEVRDGFVSTVQEIAIVLDESEKSSEVLEYWDSVGF